MLAARGHPGSHRSWCWITLAVLGARTAAMAANRYLRPRHRRAQPAHGAPRRRQRRARAGNDAVGGGAGLLLLLVAAWMLNPLCVKLLPIAVAAACWSIRSASASRGSSHFVLGAVDGLAPLGAYVGIAGRITLPALLLFAAVTIWVAGFDIIYALMDFGVDREQGISSLPARFGEASGRMLADRASRVRCSCCSARQACSPARAPSTTRASLARRVLIVYEEHLFRSGANLFHHQRTHLLLEHGVFGVLPHCATVGGFA